MKQINMKNPYKDSDMQGYLETAWDRGFNEGEKYRLALVSLTPGGSEFVFNPEGCVEFVRKFKEGQHKQILKLTKEKKEMYPKEFIDWLHGMTSPDFTERMYERWKRENPRK